QLVQESPVGRPGDELLRIRLEHPGLVEPKCVEADGVLGVVRAPLPVRQLLQHLEDVVVARSEISVDQGASGAVGLGGAEVGRLEDRAYCALGRDWGLRHELSAPGDETAEVL